MLKIPAMTTGLLLSAAVAAWAQGTWETKAPVPVAEWGYSAAFVNGKVYATTPGVVTVYTPATNAWQNEAGGPGRKYTGIAVWNGKIILAGGPNPAFQPYDRFRHRSRNVGRTLESLLDEFTTLRAANLEVLASWRLTDAQLELPGIHPMFGRVTLRQLLAGWVVHDLGHVAQVARVMAKQYKEEVGPWVDFMPVLTDHPTPRS